MEQAGCPPPVTVEGDWGPSATRTVKNKLRLYFGNERKSSGGESRVDGDGAPSFSVFFSSEDVRRRVVNRQNHEIIVDGRTIKLRLSESPASGDGASAPPAEPEPEVQPGASAPAGTRDEPVQSAAVVLDHVDDNMSEFLLDMLVEHISGLNESSYSVEIIWAISSAVITFKNPADAMAFLTKGPSNQRLQKHGLKVRLLEVAESVRVECLPPTVVKDMLELYFENNWALPDQIVMIPAEQAAIVTFKDTRVVENICQRNDYVMRSIPVKVYPYYASLGSALYGKERPKWKMPEPFTEKVHHVVWKFLKMKKLFKSINDQMSLYFCSVDWSNSDVKLSPVPSFLRQNGLTAEGVAMWRNTAQDAFRKQMSQYTAFECTVSTPAWKAAQTDIRAVVQEDAILVMDASRDTLIVAGQDDDMKRIKAPVENIVSKAMNLIKRQTEGVFEKMSLSPAMFYILEQEGLQKAAQDISPDMNLSYDEGIQMLTITGLPAEVFQAKSWILERKVAMSKKGIEVSPGLLGFLQTVDAMDMSQHLFTSQGISAIYTIEISGVLLLGSSDRVLADAESKMMKALSVQTLDVEDPEVLKLQTWTSLTQHLLDSYNSSKKKTVSIHPDRRDKITVAGFLNPVKEVSQNLKEFIVNYSQIQETIRVKSCAVVQFIDRKKSQQWSSIAKSYDVKVQFDEERPKIIIAGARLHVQQAKSSFQELISALSTGNFTVDKPGAKKYFLSHGGMLLSTVMTELSCMVVLCPENQVEEEEENFGDDNDVCYCKVQTASGVLVSVSRANICKFRVDAVVNAANEDLQHIGGLALALLKAAGPDLQRHSNDHVAKHGKLRAGDAIVTDACNLPCKYVVHAVGPRYSDYDRMTSVSRLKRAIKTSLREAERASCSTVALPAISSGVFGFPVDLCADTIAQAVREYCDSPESSRLLAEIHLVDNNHDTAKSLASAIDREFSDLEPVLTVPQPGSSGRVPQGRFQSQTPRKQQANRGGQAPMGHTRPVEHGGPRRVEQTTAEGLKIVLVKGNIQDQTTAVIVNTIADNMNLSQGAVSKAILQAAGPKLQSAVLSEANVAQLQFGDVVITDGFALRCQKIFHTVCPFWDNGAGQAEQSLTSMVRFCLEEAEKIRMPSLSIPAIGTGNLSFPRDVVSRVLLAEIHSFSARKHPQHLREVAIMVHPSDSQTVECFTRSFGGRPAQTNVQYQPFAESVGGPAPRQPPQSSASSFGQVSSPTLGVYRMQMGQLVLEVSTGDITREACDVIINSSNQTFTLQSGVSQAILAGAGRGVQQECANIVSSPGHQPRSMILTSAGSLPSRNIVHVVGQTDPVKIKDSVYAVLKLCEENKFSSVAFPALGTGQGGASPAAVADAMVDAVVEFVRKKQPRSVSSVKFLIFQTAMVPDFHRSMKKKEGQDVQEKSILSWVKDKVSSIFSGSAEEKPGAEFLVLEREEFEPTVFQLCADSDKAVSQAKKRITELIVAEQAQRSIPDPYIHHLTQADMDQLRDLQKQLTVSIRLDKGRDDQEPTIHLEGLTRDVFTAESAVRDIIRKVERKESFMNRALLVSGMVEWQFQHHNNKMVPFDIETNLRLEEALEKKQSVKIKILSEMFVADVILKTATSVSGHKRLELSRKDLKDDAALPSNWDDMKGDNSKYLYTVAAGSPEYKDVEKELTKTGLQTNIISIERVQNAMLWQSYQLKKKVLDKKNHNNKNNERQLFHGTGAKAIDHINKHGFNRSFAGQHAAMYGKGTYFAVDPIYSARGYAQPDAKGHRRMYLARVLVGDYAQGRSDMITPPSKSTANTADLYDSVTDNTANPTMFIVFSDLQAYPEYLITFT